VVLADAGYVWRGVVEVDAKGTVCLTFDFDAVSLWLARGITAPGPVSRGEFAAVAVPRVLDFLTARQMQATWFIPGHTVETYPSVCREVVAAGHEIGLHGYAHELSMPDAATERRVFERSRQVVRDLTGKPPAGYRAPGGNLSASTIALLLEAGISYDSSLSANDYRPYRCRVGDEIPPDGPMRLGRETSLVELPISWTLDDWAHFEFVREAQVQGLRSARGVLENWLADVRYMVRDFVDGVLTFVLHPEVIGRGHRFLMLEQLADTIADEGLAFSTLTDVAGRFRDGRNYGEYAPRSRPPSQQERVPANG
jgi:peptidoglycan/xylan/chitin deacetylase (PgdA/CDA1 family)